MHEQTHNVLVVEDENSVRSMLALSLKFAGYTVRTAADGLEALDEMKQRHFAVVVTDYQMPNMDGLQFLSLSRILWPMTPVIMLSGDRSEAIVERALEDGAFSWLHKPYERTVLLEILREAIQHSSRERDHVTSSRSRNTGQDGWE